jgi:AcrR family transcriptional regulator
MKSARHGTASPRTYVMRERARSTEQTRERVLEAMAELFAEGPYAQLTLAAVARRAGVSVQTVIRHFGDKEGLFATAAATFGERIRDHRDTALVGDVRQAVETLLNHYEQVGGVALRLLAEEETNPSIAAITAAGRSYHRDWCARVFGPYLPEAQVERDRRLAQLVAVCDVYTWKLLCHDAGLSTHQVTTALLELLEPLTTTRSS